MSIPVPQDVNRKPTPETPDCSPPHTMDTPATEPYSLDHMDSKEHAQNMFHQIHPVRDGKYQLQGYIRRSQDFSQGCKHYKRQHNKTMNERAGT